MPNNGDPSEELRKKQWLVITILMILLDTAIIILALLLLFHQLEKDMIKLISSSYVVRAAGEVARRTKK